MRCVKVFSLRFYGIDLIFLRSKMVCSSNFLSVVVTRFFKVEFVTVFWLYNMIEECNFKSKIMHHDSPGCRLTPTNIVCPGENNCILYQIYAKLEQIKDG